MVMIFVVTKLWELEDGGKVLQTFLEKVIIATIYIISLIRFHW